MFVVWLILIIPGTSLGTSFCQLCFKEKNIYETCPCPGIEWEKTPIGQAKTPIFHHFSKWSSKKQRHPLLERRSKGSFLQMGTYQWQFEGPGMDKRQTILIKTEVQCWGLKGFSKNFVPDLEVVDFSCKIWGEEASQSYIGILHQDTDLAITRSWRRVASRCVPWKSRSLCWAGFL